MIRKGFLKTTAFALTAAMIVSCVPGNVSKVYAAGGKNVSASAADNVGLGAERLTNGYTAVSRSYKAKKYTGSDVSFSMNDVLSAECFGYLTSEDHGYGKRVADLKVGDVIKLTIDVPETALYLIGFDYLSYDDSILPLEMSLKIDGVYPFYEMRNLKFETRWISDHVYDLDRYGNEIVVMPKKKITWLSKYLSDSSYNYSDPLPVELKKGTHEFLITINEGTFLLGDITLSAPKTPAPYKEAKKAEGNELITINAIDFYERNDSSIHAAAEYNSKLFPLSSKETVLNILDGASFDTPGQTVTYSFDVQKAGYYYIAMNYMQSEKSDFPVYVDYRIDGEIPNEEFKAQPML